jgi:hypothetical protein
MAEHSIIQKVRDSAQYVTENAVDVKINHDVLNQFVENMELGSSNTFTLLTT